MRFAHCHVCRQARALVPDPHSGGWRLRTHYLGGAKRYAKKMGSRNPQLYEVEKVRCVGSRSVVTSDSVLTLSA